MFEYSIIPAIEKLIRITRKTANKIDHKISNSVAHGVKQICGIIKVNLPYNFTITL